MQTVLVLLVFLFCNYSLVNYCILCETSRAHQLTGNTTKLQAVVCMLEAHCVQTSAGAFAANSDSGGGKRILLTPLFTKCLKTALRAFLYIELLPLWFLHWKCRFSNGCLLLFSMVAVFLTSLKVGCGVLEVSKLNVPSANIFEILYIVVITYYMQVCIAASKQLVFIVSMFLLFIIFLLIHDAV